MRTPILLCLTMIASVACGTEGNIDLLPETAAGIDATDVAAVHETAETLPHEETGEEALPDTRQDASLLLCEPGEGCFLDKCTGNEDCQSSWCVEHLGEGVCSQTCQEECPQGWSCRQVGASDPDIVWVCVSDYSNLCKPCSSSADCKSPGGADDVCVDYGLEGSFCGGACGIDAECPWGFSCKEVETVDGVPLNQCVADPGVCPCTGKSVQLALWTPCEVSNESGICSGKRICTAGGLTACDAAVPAEETCNGVDDDCDGEQDEPVLVEGKYVEGCDDDNECTLDSCKGTEGCEHVVLNQGECVDGNACTIGDHCEEGACVGLPIVCDDDNPCTDDFCDDLGGCSAQFNQSPCDDGDPCTVADQCGEGECSGFAVDCDCLTDEDCQDLEDGDLCNGTLSCSQEKVPFQCAVVPDSIVQCDPDAGEQAACLEYSCAPETGQCSSLPANEGYACDDGNACTIGDKCESGACTPGVPPNCADDNPCTDDACELEFGCVFYSNILPCNDGEVCTTDDTCAEGACLGGPPLDCDDGNPCTDDSCSQLVGCTHAANQDQCDDGDPCTVGDHCAGGACLPAGQVECDDGNACTADSCMMDGSCDHDIIPGDCDDGDPCTVNDTCINGVCSPGPSFNCSDGNPCTDDSCNDQGICVHVANNLGCDDGNECTLGDHCQGEKCVYEEAALCHDENICTTDSCDPGQGCVFTTNTHPCDDGNACTVNETCADGACGGGSPLNCDDGNICLTDICDPESGCKHLNNVEQCDDGNVCTVADSCWDSNCQSGSPLDCDDSNPCTDDSCAPDSGCVHTPNNAPCDDGSLCTEGGTCGNGWCLTGQPIICTDFDVCTDDTCDPAAGCVFTTNTHPCDDGNACTTSEKCSEGECGGGNPLNCDDGNACTDYSCDPDAGCQYADNDSLCSDNNVCTVGDLCADGLCAPGDNLACDDGNDCTDNSCDPALGCTSANNGNLCDDGVGCTVEDQCSGGSCVGTPCEQAGLFCWQEACVDHYCGDGACDAGEDVQNCPADCKPALWFESSEVEWYPIKYTDSTYKESVAVATCKAAGYRLWRDEEGNINDPDFVYDVNNSHNLGGHDIGYKVDSATKNEQEGHTGTWVLFMKDWSDSIKGVSGATNGQNVYILNKHAHAGSHETTASYTIVTPQGGSVSFVQAEYGGSPSGMTHAIVLCAHRK